MRYGIKLLGGKSDNAYSIQQTTDLGYIVAGEIQLEGNTDAWIFKLDLDGSLVWDNNFGGKEDNRANSIQQTTDGGYIVAGETAKDEGYSDYAVWVFKLDSNGEIEWDNTFGEEEEDNRAYSVQQTSDGEYIVAGKTYGSSEVNTWIFKLDLDGKLKWDKTFFGKGDDTMNYSIQQTIDEGYIAVGGTRLKDTGANHAWILKLDSNGEVEWDKTFKEYAWSRANSIQQINDLGYIVAGSKAYVSWVFKLDKDGNLDCK